MSFARDVAPLVDHCGSELCHGGLGKSWPYARLVNAPSTQCDRVLVVPGDPDASYLLHKLSGMDMCSGDRMPKLGMYFSDADMQTIADWICEGAPDN